MEGFLEELELRPRVEKLEEMFSTFIKNDWINTNDRLLEVERRLARYRLDLALWYALALFKGVGPGLEARLCVTHAREEAVRLREVIKTSDYPNEIPDDYMRACQKFFTIQNPKFRVFRIPEDDYDYPMPEDQWDMLS